MRAALRWLGRTAGSLLTALLLVGLGFYLHFLWSGPELKPWHRVRFTAEFTAADYAAGRVTTLARYREREQLLLDQVRTDIARRLDAADRLPYNRFTPGSLSDPNVWAFNWNRTFVLQPAGEPIGGVLLLHGLTDSPYSLRSIGRRAGGARLSGRRPAPAWARHRAFGIADVRGARTSKRRRSWRCATCARRSAQRSRFT